MIRSCAALVFASFLSATHLHAQGLGEAFLGGIAKESAKSAEKFLEAVPDRFSSLVGTNEKEYDSEQACLSELQLFINSAVVVSDLMPFSNVWTQETNGSASATFRLMVDGEKVHARISCQDRIMLSELLEWDAPTPEIAPYKPGTVAASLGVLLSMEQRGDFADLGDGVQENNRATGHDAEVDPEGERSHNAPSGVAEDDVDQTLEGALGSSSTTSGAPLTGGEKNALRVTVQNCWNVGSLSAEALQTTVVVGFKMDEDARPVASSIELLKSSGGNEAAAKQAYEAARRAIIRCGANGYDLPKEKYEHWREITLSFNPERMRIK
jgi:hypothetical protein